MCQKIDNLLSIRERVSIVKENKTNQRITLTKRLLQEALIRLMNDKDIANISVSELCKEAGINRTTFYYHYGNQHDVLQEMEMSMLEELRRCLSTGEGRSTRRDKTVAMFRYLQENAEWAKLMFCNSRREAVFAEKLFALTVQIRQEEHTELHTPQEMLLGTFLANGSYAMIRYWLLNGMPFTPEQMGDLIQYMATSGWQNMIDA